MSKIPSTWFMDAPNLLYTRMAAMDTNLFFFHVLLLVFCHDQSVTLYTKAWIKGLRLLRDLEGQ